MHIDLSKLTPEQRAVLEERLKQKWENRTNESQEVLLRSTSDALSLSFAQQRLWFLQELEPDSPFYNSPICLRLIGQLHVELLCQSLGALVARHEILRTRFESIDGEPVQVIDPPSSLDIPLVDLSNLIEAEREHEARSLAIQTVRRTFDLRKEHPVRAQILRLSVSQHILVLVVHHIAWDGWSVNVMHRDLEAFYKAFLTSQPPTLPDTIQYADYSLWQRKWLNEEQLQEQLAYWKRQLAYIPQFIPLPTDYVRPSCRTYEGDYIALSISPVLTHRVKGLSLRAGTTPFTTLLATFLVLLHLYTEESHVVVGTPVSGRNRRELENIIGFFVNTLAVHVEIDSKSSFWSVLKHVRETTLQAYAHQDVPFEKIVEELHVERSLSYSPIFQVMFQYNSTPRPMLQLDDVVATPFEVTKGTTQFDLAVYLTEEDGGIRGWLEYSTELFERATAQHFAAHYLRVLEAVTLDPGCRIENIELLSPAERHSLLVEWNAPETDPPGSACIHHRIETHAERCPHAIAIESGNERVTYEELNRRANQVSHYLGAAGVGPEAVVALYMERSVNTFIALLGILKAGGACLPIDPDYPRDRVLFMVEDSGARLILTHQHLESRFAGCRVPIICFDRNWTQITQYPDWNPDRPILPTNLAYVVYTSGSTGRPKGVMVVHAGMVNYFERALSVLKVQPGERVLQFQSLSFDGAAEEIFMTLTSCATLVIRTAEMLEFHSFVRACRELAINVLDIPTAYWHELVAEGLCAELGVCNALRLMIIGGERAVLDRLHNWHDQVGGRIQLFNSYGPTECTIASTIIDLTAPYDREVVPIGRPVANTHVYILNEKLQPVPIGVRGELYVNGAGLARGYLDRPDLTAERFLPDPFSTVPGASMYKTGDLVRSLPDGNLEFLGRLDNQVKLRGFRIEPGEIEAALHQHPQVREAVVMLRQDGFGEPRLVAYFVPREEHSHPTVETLRAVLAQRLPTYMLPSAFVLLEHIPRTPNGKLDRRALPAPERTVAAGVQTSAPRSLLEQTIASVWRELLSLPEVSILDNFFDLGGNSLLAVRMIVAVERAVGYEIPITLLFEAQTIEQFAQVIDVLDNPAFGSAAQ